MNLHYALVGKKQLQRVMRIFLREHVDESGENSIPEFRGLDLSGYATLTPVPKFFAP